MNNASLNSNVTEPASKHRLRLWLLKTTRVIESELRVPVTRVGLAGCDIGACAILFRIIGQCCSAELLYTGRAMNTDEGERWGVTADWSMPEIWKVPGAGWRPVSPPVRISSI